MSSGKPNPGQELIGRLALVALAGLAAIPATVLLRMALAVMQEAPDSGRVIGPLLIGAVFLYLVSAALIVLAFIPSRDSRRGPPRGFSTLSAVFDGFCAVVEKLFS
jgi:hypothetical protein